ncbi:MULTISPECIES: MBL fold metallo-hydrolase [Sphingosinicellaceae]|uniref:MBL fold metallo-hydrolase n=1 Tax=Sphingosinicellaceae TaxID=2820280 RepID=UPI001C1E100F|nr:MULTISPECIES: MBL fold metallo-hydrolase [Polymorphobacter]QYE33412.1 MBL fold metallo-hydrolase [Polymorphobacter sp. PAMC 29334]UAJ12528.1 MBL fold metallo-hydrolase [Polymorphobacter megasporae]
MTDSLLSRCAGKRESLPRRFGGPAALLLLGIGLVTAPAWAGKPTPYDTINQAAASGPITVHRLRGGIAMLDGSGGNIGVLVAPDGFLMVDAGIAVSERKIKAALRDLGGKRLRTVILTHWHWDHSDGDEWVRRTGANLIADPVAIVRLKQTNTIVEWGHTFTPVALSALPNETVPQDRTLNVGGEAVHIGHYRAGHTDGDIYVRFEHADVLQTGDTFWNGVYPFIDYVTGGSIDGAIRAADENLRLAGPNTIVIPGHGPVGDRAGLMAFRNMLVAVRGKVAALKHEGKSLDATVAARPTAEFDAKWGGSVIDPNLFTALVYRGV